MNACPNCKASWIGEPIPEDQREFFGGATNFKREIYVTVQGQDRWSTIMCPDCKFEIKREEQK